VAQPGRPTRSAGPVSPRTRPASTSPGGGQASPLFSPGAGHTLIR
jgi:hypothetical protein